MAAVFARQSLAAPDSQQAENMKNSFHVVFSCQKPVVATFVMLVSCWSKDLKSCQLELLNTGLTWWMPG